VKETSGGARPTLSLKIVRKACSRWDRCCMDNKRNNNKSYSTLVSTL